MVWKLVKYLLLPVLIEIEELRKELRMDFKNFNQALAKLASDVQAEIQAARDAIIRSAQLAMLPAPADAVAALDAVDAAVVAATAEFNPPQA